MAAYAIQFRRGTTTEHSSFTGLLGEVTVDTTKKSLVVHDGSTSGGFALALESASTSSTTGTFSSNVTVGGTLAVTSTSTFGGNMTLSGHILPSANITYDLGSTTHMWKDVYIGPGSLYINGKKVIEDDSGTISITTDVNEDLKFTTSGTGTLKFISANGINITGELGAVSGDLEIGDHMDMNSNLIKSLATPVSATDAANKAYVDITATTAVTDGSNPVSGTTGTFSGAVTVSGDLTVNGTTTSVNTANVTFEDNMFVLNSNTTGTPTQSSGFEVERGDSLNVQFLWNEADDRWTTGSNTFHATAITTPMLTGGVTGNVTGDLTGDTTGNHVGAVSGTSVSASSGFTGNLVGDTAGTHTGDVLGGSVSGTFTGDIAGNVTGNVTGNTDGTHTGAVVGNVTGNASGSAGTVTSIAGHLLDEDNMASDSATKVPSQQSVKAYVTSQIATKDNTDEMTEGSTNLYFTNARARTAISVSGDISYNEISGVISTTGLASSDTDDLAEGSTNLYFTDARADARTAVSTAANKTAWEAYADQAEADAESAAALDATSKANAAQSAAVSTAAGDAPSKANAAQSSAESTASADATSKADAAEADAISTAASTAESKDVARMITSDAYADASEAAAILSAENKDAVRATAANNYADAAVAAIVNGAPASLDTLNELAAAIADDASYSTTLTTLVGTKLALAGGAMTGAITTNSTFDGRNVSSDGSKLDGIESGSNVTDTANVTSAGALMDSELTGIAHVKSLNQALTTSSSPSFTAVTATDFNGTATYAKYADLAERYAADAPYEEGTVVMFGGEAEVTSATGYGSTKIAGVVSTKPAFAMNAEAGNSETHPYIALQGRVPCKVIGPVSKGDILVASEVSGVATVWLTENTDPRMTAYIGIAIEDKVSDTAGYVEVKVGK